MRAEKSRRPPAIASHYLFISKTKLGKSCRSGYTHAGDLLYLKFEIHYRLSSSGKEDSVSYIGNSINSPRCSYLKKIVNLNSKNEETPLNFLNTFFYVQRPQKGHHSPRQDL